MALLYKHAESRTIPDTISNAISHTVTKHVARPGILRIATMAGIAGIRLWTYLLIAHIVGIYSFGIFLLLQWLAYASLPLLGIGIDPVARRRILHLLSQEPTYGAARMFRFLLHRQSYRILYYIALHIPLAYLLSFASHGVLPLRLLLLASLASLPLLMNSIVGIAIQSQRRYIFLMFLSVLNALLTLSLVSLTSVLQPMVRLDILLLIPALAQLVTLIISAGYLACLLPFRSIPQVGPLLRQKMKETIHVSPLLFFTDIWVWRELPLLILFLINWHTSDSLVQLSCYAMSLLLATRLTEVAPAFFITCLLPAGSHLYDRIMKRPLTLGPNDAFVQATCYISLLATLLCTLLIFICPTLITLGLGSSYLPMVKMLRILLIAVVFSSIATVSLTQLERRGQLLAQKPVSQYQRQAEQHKQLRRHLYLRLETVVMYIALMLPCVFLWGLTGAALASMLVRVAFALCSILQCHRLLRAFPSLTSPMHLPSYHIIHRKEAL